MIDASQEFMPSAAQTTDSTTTDGTSSQVPASVEVSVWRARRKMAWLALWGIILPTTYIILKVSDVNVLSKFADLLSWYYLSLASIVGAFFGFTAWASIKGRGTE